MGNSASVPKEAVQHVEHTRGTAKPPNDWNNGKSFVMISPQSDLSNPSQFRHRFKESHAGLADLQAASRAVVPRQRQRRGSVPPPPATFYFDQENQSENFQNKQMIDQQQKSKWIKEKQRVVKRKAKRAKRVFKGCWEEKREAFQTRAREKEPAHQRLRSLTPRNKTPLDEKASESLGESLHREAPQLVLPLKSEDGFHPVFQDNSIGLEDKKNYEIKPYIHDEEVFVGGIMATSADGPDTPYVQAKPGKHVSKIESILQMPEAQVNDNVLSQGLEEMNYQPCSGPEEHIKESSDSTSDKQTPVVEITTDAEVVAKLCGNVIAKSKSYEEFVSSNDKRRQSNQSKTGSEMTKQVHSEEQKSSPKASDDNRSLRVHANPKTKGLDVADKSSLESSGGNDLLDKTSPKEKLREKDNVSSTLSRKRSNVPAEMEKHAESKIGQHQGKNAGSLSSEQGVQPNVENVLQQDKEIERKGNHKNNDETEFNLLQGSTIRQMLLQTYPIANTCATQSSNSSNTDQTKTDCPKTIDRCKALVYAESPVMSKDSPGTQMSDTSYGMVSTQALRNASFLFSPSYADGDKTLLRIPEAPKGTNSFSISTVSAQNRLVSRPRPDPHKYCPGSDDDSHSASSRKVHFSNSSKSEKSRSGESQEEASETTQPEQIHVQSIPRNLSDLTDSTGLTRESVASLTGVHQMCFKPIIEEEERESLPADVRSSASIDPPPSEDSTSDDEKTRDSIPSGSSDYPTNWFYSVDKDPHNGVTPLRNGKFAINATHSPFLRFKEAKKKFSGESDLAPEVENQPGTNQNKIKDDQPTGGLVRSRIVAMEEKASLSRKSGMSSSSGGSTSSNNIPNVNWSHNANKNVYYGITFNSASHGSLPRSSSHSSNDQQDVDHAQQKTVDVPALQTKITRGSSGSDLSYRGSSQSQKTSDSRAREISPSSSAQSISRRAAVNGPSEMASRWKAARRSSTGTIISDRSQENKSHLVLEEKSRLSRPSREKDSASALNDKSTNAAAWKPSSENRSVGCNAINETTPEMVRNEDKSEPQSEAPLRNGALEMKSTVKRSTKSSKAPTIGFINQGNPEKGAERKESTRKPDQVFSKFMRRSSTGSNNMNEKGMSAGSNWNKRLSNAPLSSPESTCSNTTCSNSTIKVPRPLRHIKAFIRRSSESYDGDASKISSCASTTDESRRSVANNDAYHSKSHYKVSFDQGTIQNGKLLVPPRFRNLSGNENRLLASDIGSTYGSELDTTVDDFAALLQGEGSDDESSTAETNTEITVSTVQKNRDMERMISKEPGFSEEDDTTICSASLGTVSTVRQARDTYSSAAASSTLSSVMRNEKDSLPFRDSSTVRPDEQLHRTVPGNLHLSPTQKTPMQARKWRALAAAAKEKNSASKSKFSIMQRAGLSERDTNIHHM